MLCSWACSADTLILSLSSSATGGQAGIPQLPATGKEGTGIIEEQLMFALLDLWWHCSFQSHFLPVASSPPGSLCGFSFISCFLFSLELAVRAEVEVEIKLQLRSALLGKLWSWLSWISCQEEQSLLVGCDQTETFAFQG